MKVLKTLLFQGPVQHCTRKTLPLLFCHFKLPCSMGSAPTDHCPSGSAPDSKAVEKIDSTCKAAAWKSVSERNRAVHWGTLVNHFAPYVLRKILQTSCTYSVNRGLELQAASKPSAVKVSFTEGDSSCLMAYLYACWSELSVNPFFIDDTGRLTLPEQMTAFQHSSDMQSLFTIQ